jgi:hypothetical protein
MLNEAETISADWTNTANPWADNEVADDLTISGGTIDNTIIGGTTAAAGSFTTLSASGALTATGDLDIDFDSTTEEMDILDTLTTTGTLAKNTVTITRSFDDTAATDVLSGSILKVANSVTLDAVPAGSDASDVLELVQDADSTGNLLVAKQGASTKFSIDKDGLITLANSETIDNATDGTVNITGNLSVGGATETIANAGFVMNGDDQFVAGMLGVEGDIYTDGTIYGTIDASSSGISLDDAYNNSGADPSITIDTGSGASGLTFQLTGKDFVIDGLDSSDVFTLQSETNNDTATMYINDTATANQAELRITPSDGGVVIDTPGADELASMTVTDARESLAISTNPDSAGDADGVIKLGKQEGNWEYIWYDASLRSGKGQFVLSAPIKIIGSSPAVITFVDGATEKTLEYDATAGTDGQGAFVFSDQAEIPSSSPGYLVFGTTDPNVKYALKLNPETTPKTLSVVEITNPGPAATETTLFEFAADGTFGVYDPLTGDRTFSIDEGRKWQQEFENFIFNGSFEAFSKGDQQTYTTGGTGFVDSVIDGWFNYQYANIYRIYAPSFGYAASPDVKFGYASIRVEDWDTAYTQGIQQEIPEFELRALQGQKVTLSVYAKDDPYDAVVTNTTSIGYEALDSTGAVLASGRRDNLAINDTDFTLLDYTFTVPTNAFTLYIRLYGADASGPGNLGAVVYDGVALTKGAIVTPFRPSAIKDTGFQTIYGDLEIARSGPMDDQTTYGISPGGSLFVHREIKVGGNIEIMGGGLKIGQASSIRNFNGYPDPPGGTQGYSYMVTAFDGTSESMPSEFYIPDGPTTLDASNYIRLMWDPAWHPVPDNVPSGAKYFIYRYDGATFYDYVRIAELDAANLEWPEYNDTGAAILDSDPGTTGIQPYYPPSGSGQMLYAEPGSVTVQGRLNSIVGELVLGNATLNETDLIDLTDGGETTLHTHSGLGPGGTIDTSGTNSDSWTIDADATAGNIALRFKRDTAPTFADLTWEEINNRFSFTNDVDISGNLTLSGTVDGVDVSAHDTATTGIHGVGTGLIVGTDLPQTLTNKTIDGNFNTLTVLETQITDDTILARLAANETVSGSWTYSGNLTLNNLLTVEKSYTNQAVSTGDHTITRNIAVDDGTSKTTSGDVLTINTAHSVSGVGSSLTDDSTLLKLQTGPNVGGNGMFLNAVDSTGTSQFYVNKDGDVWIGGDLQVEGAQTILNVQTVEVESNKILMNRNVTGAPSLDAFIEVNRGTSPSVNIKWAEGTDRWQFTNDGTNYHNLPLSSEVAPSGVSYLVNAADNTLTNEVVVSALAADLSIKGDDVAGRTITLGQQVTNADIINFDVPSSNVQIGGAQINFSHLAGTVADNQIAASAVDGGIGGEIADNTIDAYDLANSLPLDALTTITTSTNNLIIGGATNKFTFGDGTITEAGTTSITSDTLTANASVRTSLVETLAAADLVINPDSTGSIDLRLDNVSSRVKTGIGQNAQVTLTNALDTDDFLIKRNVTGLFAEAGSLLKLEKDISGNSTYNSNFIEASTISAGPVETTKFVVDKDGNISTVGTVDGVDVSVLNTRTGVGTDEDATSLRTQLNNLRIFTGANTLTDTSPSYGATPYIVTNGASLETAIAALDSAVGSGAGDIDHSLQKAYDDGASIAETAAGGAITITRATADTGGMMTLTRTNATGGTALSVTTNAGTALSASDGTRTIALADATHAATATGKIAIAENPAATDSDGTLNLGRNGSAWEYIMWDDSADGGQGAFIISDNLHLKGASPSTITLWDGANSKTITYDANTGVTIADNTVITGSLTVEGASPAGITFGTGAAAKTLEYNPITGEFSFSGGKLDHSFQNLVRNGSFELYKPTGWLSHNNGYQGLTDPVDNLGKFGQKAVRVSDNSTVSAMAIKFPVPNYDRLKGKKVTLSVWARTNAGTAKASVGFSASSTATDASSVQTIPLGATDYLNTTWQQFTYTFDVPATADDLTLYLYGSGGFGTSVDVTTQTNDYDPTATEIYFDGVTVVEGALALDYGPSPIFDTGPQVIYGNLAIGAHVDPSAGGQVQLVFGEPPSDFGSGYGVWGMEAGTITYEQWGPQYGRFLINRGIKILPTGVSGPSLHLIGNPRTSPNHAEPLFLLGSSVLNTASANASESGTFVGINASGFSGDFINFQVDGTSKFRVDAAGNITAGNLTATTISANGTTAETFTIDKGSATATQNVALQFSDDGADSAHSLTWHDTNNRFEFSNDVYAAGNLTIAGVGASSIAGRLGIGKSPAAGTELDVNGDIAVAGNISVRRADQVVLGTGASGTSYVVYNNATNSVSFYVDGVEVAEIVKK